MDKFTRQCPQINKSPFGRERRAEAVLKPGPFASQTGSRVHYEFVSVQPTNRPVNKEYNKETTIAQLLGKKWFLWWNCRSNICDKHPKSESCRRLFGWCCYRAYRLITTEWNAKRIYVKDAKISYQFMSGNFAFIFNTLHCEAYRRDGLVTFQTQLQKLHTSATFCRHLRQTLKIKRMVPPERWKILLYLVEIILSFIWPHQTVLQTSATNSQ